MQGGRFFPVCGKIVFKRKITADLAVIFLKNGGPDRIRTDDPYNANVVRSQTVQFYAPQTTQETADNNQILSEKSEKSIWPCSILHGTSQEASILR